VEVIGFEPTAPSLRTKCSAELSYTPRSCSAGVYPRISPRPNAHPAGVRPGQRAPAIVAADGGGGTLTVQPAPRPARPFDRTSGATVAGDGSTGR
jgi:hypothetical protein